LSALEIEELAEQFLYGHEKDIQLNSLKELNKLIKQFKKKHLATVEQLNRLKKSGLDPRI
jgi:hypothetical protein